MNTEKVYKVVKNVDNRFISAYVSFWNNDTLTREYAIGTVTMPLPETKLFAFHNIEDARQYIRDSERNDNMVIFEAIGVNPKPMFLNTYLAMFGGGTQSVIDWFKNNDAYGLPSDVYKSSVGCDSIELTKLVQ